MNTLLTDRGKRACPICHNHTFVHFADEYIDPNHVGSLSYASRKPPEFMCLNLIRCTNCDLVYTPSPPTADFLQKAYSDAGFDSGSEAIAAAHTYAAALTPFIEQLPGRGAAIDIGAGSGPLLPWLKDQGFSPVIGIEPSRAAIDAAPPEVRVLLREGMFSPAMLEGERPDLLCSFMTLEHLAEPELFIATAYRLLNSNGALAVVVHDWRTPFNRLLGRRSPIIDIEHLQLFSSHAIRRLLEQSGFKSVVIRPICNAYPLRYWLRLTPMPLLLKRLTSRLFEFLGLADRIITLNVGNLLAVGIK